MRRKKETFEVKIQMRKTFVEVKTRKNFLWYQNQSQHLIEQ